MTAAQFELIDETEAEAILRWRFEELVRAGYDVGSALVLASHVEIDLHDASDLACRGCPPETAVRILLLSGGEGRAPMRRRPGPLRPAVGSRCRVGGGYTRPA